MMRRFLVILLFLVLAAAQVPAAEPPEALSPPAVERAVREELKRPEFDWRLPKEEEATEPELPGFLTAASEFISDSVATIGRWAKKALEWIGKLLPKPKFRAEENEGSGSADAWYGLALALVAAVASVVAVAAYRRLRQRKQPEAAPAPEPVAVDATAEETTADLLPEEEWLALARQLLASGERRGALRALFLATLSRLASADLIMLQKAKSNREYERELTRRGHALPEVVSSFAASRILFERCWYGMREVTDDTIAQLREKYERIAGHAR